MKLSEFRTIWDRIVVKPIEGSDKTEGGLFIPDQAKQKPQLGLIVICGSGKLQEDGTRKPMNIKLGDKVLYNRHDGMDLILDGEKYLGMNESDVLGVVE